MIKPYLIICSGISDSGKDSCYLIINQLLNNDCINIKFTESWKRFFETILNIPDKALDDKDYRTRKVVNTLTNKEEDYTYNDFMYNWYHNLETINPGKWLFAGYEYNRIKDLRQHKCLTDVRNKSEIEVINKLKSSHIIVLLKISGRGTAKSTDNNINSDDINYHYCFNIKNNKTFDYLKMQLQFVLDYIDNVEYQFN